MTNAEITMAFTQFHLLLLNIGFDHMRYDPMMIVCNLIIR